MEHKKKIIYLDHAATTPVDSRVRDAMLPYLGDEFGNPGALYFHGRHAREAVRDARASCSAVMHARSDEIFFTGSGTESDNMAILGIARAHKKTGNHIITSAIEHHAVLYPCEYLEERGGCTVTFLKPNQFGQISAEQVIAALTPETVLVSLMYANNEIGTINPIARIGAAIREKKKEWGRGPLEAPFFHTDACQAAGYLDLDVQKLGVDLMTINGSKIYGPKGVGVLYKKRGIVIEPLVFGGGQEFRMRSGTENVAGIVGLSIALQLVAEDCAVESARLVQLRDRLIQGIFERIPDVVLNGHPIERLPNNANISILDIEGEAMLLYLDEAGIETSTGSACDSESLEPSHVILGIGRPYEYAHASLRFTLGRSTTQEGIDYVLEVLPGVVKKLRSISPVRATNTVDRKAFVSAGRPHWERN